MGLLTWLVVGAIAGWLAGQVMKGSGFGLIGDIVIGVIGALVGGLLARSSMCRMLSAGLTSPRSLLRSLAQLSRCSSPACLSASLGNGRE